jgi:GH24 family phage-related lysozyme (muramidase)
MPHINDAGLKIIENSEGLRLRAYPDPGTGGEPFTIGWGHTAAVHPGQVCTLVQALAFLRNDVANAERTVAANTAVVLTPNQFSALVSFEFNTGAFAGGHPIVARINAHDFGAALAHLKLYVNGGDGLLPGLVTRRAAEAALFLTA